MKKEYLFAGVSIFCWGTMAPVSKLLLEQMPNMVALTWVMGIAAVALLAVILLTGQGQLLRQYTLRDYAWLTANGAGGYFLYSALYYYAISILPAQTACILNYLWPILTVCLSAVLLRERLSPPKLLALGLSFLGVIVIVLRPGGGQGGGERTAGYLACILAAVCYAAFNVVNKKRGGNQMVNTLVYHVVGTVLSGFCCLKTGIVLPTAGQWAGLLWMGVGVSAVGIWLWAMALQKSNTAAIANFAYITPAISIFLSAWWLREPVYSGSLLGLVLILGGFFLQMALERRAAPI